VGTLPEITASPEFKKWFGDSKVVDAEGKPLVMYHGQPRPEGKGIEKFEPSKEDGIYFSSDREYAEGYAVEFRAEKQSDEFDHFALTGTVYPAFVSIKKPFEIKGIEQPELLQKYQGRGFNREKLIKEGYDGIIVRYSDNGEVEAQAFHPEQVK